MCVAVFTISMVFTDIAYVCRMLTAVGLGANCTLNLLVFVILKSVGGLIIMNRIIFDEFITTGALLLSECANSLSHMTRLQFVA